MKKLNKTVMIIVALMAALTALTAVGLYTFISYGYYIASAIITAIYPIGIAAGIATIKYELED